MTNANYRSAGVDLDLAQHTKKLIWQHAKTTFGPGVIGDIGSFGGMFHLTGYRDPVLVSSTDNVGTKLKIATLRDKYDTVGIDVVNQSLNDIFVLGAKPLFFLDYIAVGKLVPERVESIVRGIVQACREAGIALIGGETAELPGIYQGNDFDLSGFIVGAVERDEIIDGSKIQKGDVLLGIPSSGLHTNGYSLVRMVFQVEAHPEVLETYYPQLGRRLGEALLEPHRSYYPILKEHLPLIKGMAHITGGSFAKNVPRVLPKGVAARIQTGSWEVLPLFKLIQERGRITNDEMYRVFNMGIGMIVYCDAAHAGTLKKRITGAVEIGSVVAQKGDTQLELVGL